jgi:hypothetical protein
MRREVGERLLALLNAQPRLYRAAGLQPVAVAGGAVSRSLQAVLYAAGFFFDKTWWAAFASLKKKYSFRPGKKCNPKTRHKYQYNKVNYQNIPMSSAGLCGSGGHAAAPDGHLPKRVEGEAFWDFFFFFFIH